MKKYLIFISVITLLSATISSCKDDGKEIEYANHTTEQNKQNIETEGMRAVEKLDGMKDLSAISTIKDFASLIGSQNNNMVYSPMKQLLAPIANMDKNVMGLTALRSSNASIDSIINIFQEYGGVYTYYSNLDSFVRVKNTSEITFRFPIGNSATNNGRITINNFSSKFSTNPNFPNQELLKSLDIKLWNGNTLLLGIEMDASYNADDLPSMESTVVTFKEGYSFSEAISNTQSDVAWNVAFALNNSNIINAEFKTNGNYSYSNLNSIDQINGSDQINQFLNSANAFVQVGNIKMVGSLDFNKFMDQYDKQFQNDEMEGSKADFDKLCELMNANASIILMYVDKKTAIAKSSFYTQEETDSYYNGSGYTNYTNYNLAMKFVFKDGSAVSDNFFTNGFEDLISSFDTFLNEMESSYAPQ